MKIYIYALGDFCLNTTSPFLPPQTNSQSQVGNCGNDLRFASMFPI